MPSLPGWTGMSQIITARGKSLLVNLPPCSPNKEAQGRGAVIFGRQRGDLGGMAPVDGRLAASITDLDAHLPLSPGSVPIVVSPVRTRPR
jgi:hypothetical protein